MSLNILLNGASGRMGQAIAQVAESEATHISAAIDIGDAIQPALANCDVVIDFSFHDATVPLLESCAEAGKPVVIGTTGHSETDKRKITDFSRRLPIVWAGNYSVGVNLLFHLVEQTARILDERYHPEVVEMHHRHKKDAPSGTAEGLVQAILSGRNWDPSAVVNGREGISGERPGQQIGVHALRGGDVVGDHQVIFAGEGERIELSHRASDRAIFARGALRAAHWVADKPAGLYAMLDVLGLRQPGPSA